MVIKWVQASYSLPLDNTTTVADKVTLNIVLLQWPLREPNAPHIWGVSHLPRHATHPCAMLYICNRYLSIPVGCITMVHLFI